MSAGLVLRAVDAGQREPRVEPVGEYRDGDRRGEDGSRISRRVLLALGGVV